MSPKRKAVIFFALLLVLGPVATLLFVLKPAPPLPQVRLTNLLVTLEGATYGDTHKFPGVHPWKRNLLFYVPNPVQNIIGSKNITAGFSFPGSLVVWLSVLDEYGRRYTNFSGRVELIDEHGCAFPSTGAAFAASDRFATPCFAFASFPRRQKEFLLRAFHGDQPLFEFTVTNPVRPAFSNWVAQPLPVTRKLEDLEVVLEELRLPSPSNTGSGPPAASLKLLEQGRPSTNWALNTLSWSDSTGNQGPHLCPHEPVWKIDASLLREVGARFDNSEIWKIPALAAPAPGKVLPLSASFHRGTIKPLFLCGPGSFKFSNEVCLAASPWAEGMLPRGSFTGGKDQVLAEFSRNTPTLILKQTVLPTSSEYKLTIRAVDPSGIVHPLTETTRTDQFVFYQFLEPVPSTSTFDLQIILQRSRHLEFFVRPAFPPIDSPSR